MAQTFKRLSHAGDVPHLAVTLKRYISDIQEDYSTLDSPVFTGDPQAPTPPTGDNDTSIATTAFVKNQNYAPLASPLFTGDPHAPTPATVDNDTSVATTAFVKAQGYQIGNQTITLSGDITGAGTVAITTTLPNINSNTGTFQGISVNAKGQVTAASDQTGHLPGTATNDAAAAGQVGEVITAITTAGVAMPGNTHIAIASFTLTPGDWDVSGEVWIAASATPAQYIAVGINTVVSVPTGAVSLNTAVAEITYTTTSGPNLIMPLAPFRVSISTPTLYYLLGYQYNATGITGTGKLFARRAR